jgi:Fe-Mn family superoxide dismutase
MSGSVRLPPLPYDEGALAPAISARTVAIHYGKHHRAYVEQANKGLEAAPELAHLSLDKLVIALANDPERKKLFNNAAQAWNHEFYWNSLTPKPNEPGSALAELIRDAFGDVEACKQALTGAGMEHFGTGWAWLVLEKGKLAVTHTDHAETPLTSTARPLLTVDVWEHAWYLDRENRKAEYLAAVEPLLNWRFAEQNLG